MACELPSSQSECTVHITQYVSAELVPVRASELMGESNKNSKTERMRSKIMIIVITAHIS
jgi:hypothetical protein